MDNNQIISNRTTSINNFFLEKELPNLTRKQTIEFFQMVNRELTLLADIQAIDLKTLKVLFVLSEKIERMHQIAAAAFSLHRSEEQANYLSVKTTLDTLMQKFGFTPLFEKLLSQKNETGRDEEVKQKLAEDIAEQFKSNGYNRTLQSLKAMANTPERQRHLQCNLILIIGEGYFKNPPVPVMLAEDLYLLDTQKAISVCFSDGLCEAKTFQEIYNLEGILSRTELDLYIAWMETGKQPTTLDDWIDLGKAAHFFGDNDVAGMFAAFIDYEVVRGSLKVKEYKHVAPFGIASLYSEASPTDHARQLNECRACLQSLLHFSDKKDLKFLAKRGFSAIFARLAAVSYFILATDPYLPIMRSMVNAGSSREAIIKKLHELTEEKPENKAVALLDIFGTSSVASYPENNFFLNFEPDIVCRLLPSLPHFILTKSQNKFSNSLPVFMRDKVCRMALCRYLPDSVTPPKNSAQMPIAIHLPSLQHFTLSADTFLQIEKIHDDNSIWHIEYDQTVTYSIQLSNSLLSTLSLDITSRETSSEIFEAIPMLKNLTHLRLRIIGGEGKEVVNISQILSKLLYLKRLTFWTRFSGPYCALTEPFPNLERLDLGDCILHSGVIKGCNKASVFKLRGCTITNLEEFNNLKHLEDLALYYCTVKAEEKVENRDYRMLSIKDIAEHVSSKSVKRFSYVSTSLSSDHQGKIFFENFPNLETLRVGGAGALDLLLQFSSPSLQHLILIEQAYRTLIITKDALDRVFKNFPNLKIVSVEKQD